MEWLLCAGHLEVNQTWPLHSWGFSWYKQTDNNWHTVLNAVAEVLENDPRAQREDQWSILEAVQGGKRIPEVAISQLRPQGYTEVF